ncbi:DUF1801 domain-containing protein [Pseudarthrobacter sp. N5]|uniref:DUF1801 domain-containing protein n=1 Tax=Pseudarthrobacter sp. N5 TaxID=3418416 RepID=UPI003CED7E40
MAENKTQPTRGSVLEFLSTVEHPVRRGDGLRPLELMTEINGEEPLLWGPTMVGFGAYRYKYGSGREGDAACLYGNKLADVDEAVLAELVRAGQRHMTSVLHQG